MRYKSILATLTMLFVGVGAYVVWLDQRQNSALRKPHEKKLVEAERSNKSSPVGQVLAEKYCSTCHLYVQPEDLPKSIWEQSVIPSMGAYMGMHLLGFPYRGQLANGFDEEDRKISEQSGFYATQPMLSKSEWLLLTDYIIDSAPVQLPKSRFNDMGELKQLVGLFEEKTPVHGDQTASTLHISFNKKRQLYIAGSLLDKTLNFYSLTGQLIESLTFDSPPLDADFVGDSLFVTEVGILSFNNLPRGKIVQFSIHDSPFSLDNRKIAADGFIRPVNLTIDDIDANGSEDFIVSEFGYLVGRLSLSLREDDEVESVLSLSTDPGSMVSYVRDLNNDGIKDIIALTGQSREGVNAYYGSANGVFTASPLVSFPPHYGVSHFDLHDFNGDGNLDLLVTNGDNADLTQILKPYHGIRIFLNDGHNGFTLNRFIGIPGAYKSLAYDYDEDGDLDIFVISMFADYESSSEHSLLYLENLGEQRFETYYLSGEKRGRWLTSEMADIDDDGDMDLIVGSFTVGPIPARPEAEKRWASEKIPFMVLENQSRQHQ